MKQSGAAYYFYFLCLKCKSLRYRCVTQTIVWQPDTEEEKQTSVLKQFICLTFSSFWNILLPVHANRKYSFFKHKFTALSFSRQGSAPTKLTSIIATSLLRPKVETQLVQTRFFHRTPSHATASQTKR